MAEQIEHSQTATPPRDSPVILHLSDLHFGNDENPQRRDDRKAAMACLADRIASLDGSWHPKYVCITGDIGYRGKPEDYTAAADWLVPFLKRLSVSSASVFMCPGNHDVFRPLAEKHGRPNCAEEADKMLSLPLSSHFDIVFSQYSAFQEKAHIPKYEVGGGTGTATYLYGVRQTQDRLRFICVNSCWYSKDENDRQNLWIGLPLLWSLRARQLICRRSESQTIDIALMHHPKEYLAQPECNAWGTRRGVTFDFLARMSHIILTGHTHANLRSWDQNEHEAYICGGGASWISISHPNTFRLIRIDRDKQVFEYKSFQWDASAPDWQEVSLSRDSCFFQDKLDRDLADRYQSQRTSSQPAASIQKPEPEGPGVEMLCETSIQASNDTVVLSKGATELHDRPVEADLIVRELIDKMRSFSINGDYPKALACWEKNSDWFAARKPQIDAALADELTVLVEEVRLYLEKL